MKSKQSIGILITLMSIALLGVIIIQFLWIKNAMQMKQEQFDRNVNSALVRVSADLESKYGVHWITEKLESDSSALREVMSQDPGFYKFMVSADENTEPSDEGDGENQHETDSQVIMPGKDTTYIYSSTTSADGKRKHEVVTEINHKNGAVNMVEKNAMNEQSVVESMPNAMENSIPDPPEAPATPDNRVKPPKGSRLISIVKSAADEWAMSKMDSKEVSNALDSDVIRAAIKKEFERQGLPGNFVFATYCTAGDTLMINKAASANPLQDFAFHAPLMSTDFIDEGSLLLINFPQHYKYLFASVAGMLVLSLIFTISIIATFAYSLHVIFKQKKVTDITNDFINNMTHELKTPLATISMTADTLALATVSHNPGLVDEYSGMIKQEVKKLSLHVDKILKAALLEKNGDKNQHELICINRLIEEEVKTFEPLVQQRNGTITAGVSTQLITLQANKDLLCGAVSNLLDNALKYSNESPQITISANTVPGKILLSVKDNGIGISKADQGLIFEKFYRAPTGNRHDVKGFGLGLSYVKDVIENLKGKVWVESEPGKGSTFFIELPVN